MLNTRGIKIKVENTLLRLNPRTNACGQDAAVKDGAVRLTARTKGPKRLKVR